jgi:energy-coupling factor transporter ATP-binding protein EcfA2
MHPPQVCYAITCYRGELSDSAVASAAIDILAATGLTSCKQVRAGDGSQSGLSGGQRRRLSLAVALAKKPAVIIADEPTSGLDAAAAAAIMRLLGDLARKSRVAVICTLHQPSASVYAGIDTLLLLTGGRTAYCGSAGMLHSHLASLGKPVPAGTSTPEHALELVNADFASDGEVDAVLDAWRAKGNAKVERTLVIEPLPTPPLRAACLRAVWTLLRRDFAVYRYEGLYFQYRLVLDFALATLYGVWFVHVRKREQEDVYSIFYLSCARPSGHPRLCLTAL